MKPGKKETFTGVVHRGNASVIPKPDNKSRASESGVYAALNNYFADKQVSIDGIAFSGIPRLLADIVADIKNYSAASTKTKRISTA
jgi:hypothetical protein